MAKSKVNFNKEQQEKLLSMGATGDQLKAIKRLCGISDPIPPAGDQINGAAKAETYKNREYVSVPYVKLGDKESAKGVFLRRKLLARLPRKFSGSVTRRVVAFLTRCGAKRTTSMAPFLFILQLQE